MVSVHIIWVYLRRLVEWLLLFAIGHGIILFLATREIFPDRFAASMITAVTEAPIWAQWIMAGTFGLLGTFILERFFWRSSLAPPPIASQKDASTEPAVAPDAQGYMTAYEVIHYLADDSKWGNEVRQHVSADGMRKMVLLEAPSEFKRIAEHGRIHAVGRLNGSGQHVPIQDTYWMSATLSQFSLNNREISETIPTVPNPDGIPVYKNVMILREDVERTWPR
ncbi:MAG: hypothetical protein ACLPSW_01260 [Roseiarcus sp.]